MQVESVRWVRRAARSPGTSLRSPRLYSYVWIPMSGFGPLHLGLQTLGPRRAKAMVNADSFTEFDLVRMDLPDRPVSR
ncbi:hypothetical protein IMCC26207_109419 [Actinobacteria bacterium IMCC26207]|nr:hypothetical protein IMCC26207_109419 [Actinobacteria bacterium IMCC26207]